MRKNKGLIVENIPNILTVSRFILSFVVMYLIFVEGDIRLIIVVFAIAALTDFFDGILARKFHWESEFGRRADIIADRFLWVGTTFAFLISYGLRSELGTSQAIQLLLIMSRELISAPFALIAFFSGKVLPDVRYIAKVTTFLQGFALPAIILSTYVSQLVYLAWILSIIVAITGFMSAMHYLRDVNAPRRVRKK